MTGKSRSETLRTNMPLDGKSETYRASEVKDPIAAGMTLGWFGGFFGVSPLQN
jgi:hypothetical protein